VLDVTPLSRLRVVYRDDQVVGVDIWETGLGSAEALWLVPRRLSERAIAMPTVA
jgi:hypothetical protein